MIPWGGGGPSLPPAFHTPLTIPLAWSLPFCPPENWPSEEAFIRKHPEGTWKEHDTFTMILFIMSLCLLRTEKVTPLQVPQQVGWLTGVRERQALMGVQRQSKFPQGQLGLSFGCLPPTPPLSWHRACPLAWDLPEHIEQPVPEKRGKLFGLKLTPPRTLLPALLRVLGRGALLFLGRGL